MRLHVCFACLVFLIFGASCVHAQDFIQIGPFGRPLVVKNEYDQASIPIRIYSTPDIDFYVPDVTQTGWIVYARQPFDRAGEFTFTLYAHFKTFKGCMDTIPVATEEGKKQDCALVGYEMLIYDASPNTGRGSIVRTSVFRKGDGYIPVLQDTKRLPFTVPKSERPLWIAYNRAVALILRQFKETATRDSYPTR